TCASEAYALWRQNGRDEAPAHSTEPGPQHMVRVARNAWTETGQAHMLAVHDQTSLRAGGEPAAHLRATLLLDAHGGSLTSPLHQLTLPSGWLSSRGVSRAGAPAAGRALLGQMEWLAAGGPDLPLVHLFEGGNAALWSELAQRPLQWMAQVPAITRIYMEDGSTTVQADSKMLNQRLVVQPLYASALTDVAGRPA